jgi:hypothetical protein
MVIAKDRTLHLRVVVRNAIYCRYQSFMSKIDFRLGLYIYTGAIYYVYILNLIFNITKWTSSMECLAWYVVARARTNSRKVMSVLTCIF